MSALVAVSLAIMMGTPMTAFANEATNTTNPNTNANTTNNTTNNNTTTDNNSAALSENLPLAKPSIWAIPETSLAALTPLGGPIGGDPSQVTVDDWADLKNAMSDPIINYIEFSTDITRSGGTEAANDLPPVTRTLTINGNGNTLNLCEGTTPIPRRTFTLAASAPADSQFTLQNININRATGGASQMISAATGDAATAGQSVSNANGQNWTINLENVDGNAAGAAPSGGLLTASGATLNVTGNLTWDNSTGGGTAQTIINARYQNYDAADVFIQGIPSVFDLATNNGLVMAAAASSATDPQDCWFTVTNGSKVLIQTPQNTVSTSTLCVGRDAGGMSPKITVEKDSLLEVHSLTDNFDYQAAITMLGENAATGVGRGGIDIREGGKLEAYADRTDNLGGMAILIQLWNGEFNIDGEGSELYAKSNSSQDGYAACIRFRLVGNQSFNVSHNGKVKIEKYARIAGAGALRFGVGLGNGFYVSSGGSVEIINYGNGGAPAVDASARFAQACVEFEAADWTFDVRDKNSVIILDAKNGAAVTSTFANGTIYVGEGSIFLVEGNMGNNTTAIFNAGANFTFTADHPMYYDFANTNPAPGRIVFNTTAPATFTSNNSDVAVWGNGNNRDSAGAGGANSSDNPIDNNPYMSWSMISYSLSGANFPTLVSPVDDAYFNTGADNFGSRGMVPYRRISGNNATVKISELLQPTNADKYVRALGSVPEGTNLDGRYLWDGEAYGRFDITSGGGAPTSSIAGEVTSIREEPVYTIETGVDTLEGVLRYAKPNDEFLLTGDTYKLTSVWRGEFDDPDSLRIHVSQPDEIPSGAVTVVDVLPPVPASITMPNNGKLWQGLTTEIAGSWLPGAQQASVQPHNPDPAVKLYAVLKTVGGETSIIDNEAGNPVEGALKADGTWVYILPASVVSTLALGDEVYFVLEDELGNANPLVDTAIHDTTKLAAPHLTVLEPELTLSHQDQHIGLQEAAKIAAFETDSASQYAALKELIEARAEKLFPSVELDTAVSVTNVTPSWDELGYYQDRETFMADNPEGKVYAIRYAADADATIYQSGLVTVYPYPTPYVDARDFSISVNHASAMMSKPAAERDAQLKELAEALGRMTVADSFTAAMVEVVSTTIPTPTGAEGAVPAGDYDVTFRVIGTTDEQHSLTIKAHVIPGNMPIILIDAPISVWNGDASEPFEALGGSRPTGSILP
ncbi:MAG: hypothetical protein FWG24_07185, partial [Eggerthellaceae bacterium]|nr:hypothetical protein [Eggerthellaceae bacterium]